jgi:hypothetical protein
MMVATKEPKIAQVAINQKKKKFIWNTDISAAFSCM